jgi:hypothetical protein
VGRFLEGSRRVETTAGDFEMKGFIALRSVMPPRKSERQTLSIGARVRLSALGQERSPKTVRTGEIVGAIGSSFAVLLDGAKTSVRLHFSYLEKADEKR